MTRIMHVVDGELVPMTDSELDKHKEDCELRLYKAEFAYLVANNWVAYAGVPVTETWGYPEEPKRRIGHTEALSEQKKRDGLP